MFSRIWTSGALVFALALQAHAHAAVSPALGVAGNPSRSDVKRPNAASPCGRNVNIAQALAQSTPVVAAADGTFTATVTNFNAGVDGSRRMSAKVDAAATGGNFVDATVSQNGDPAPSANGSQQLVAQLPAGTQCTGGAAGNKCLVQFRSVAGFGNCLVVQQGGAAPAAPAPAAPATPAAPAASNGRGGRLAQTLAGFGGRQRRSISGTRSARALLADIGERGEEALEVVKRGVASWIWA